MSVEEAMTQWIGYCGLLTRYAPNGESVDLDGVAVRWLNAGWPSMNACIVNTPVLDRADLDRRTAAAIGFASARNRKWVFATCDELLPEGLQPNLREVSRGVGMIAERLLPRLKRAPSLEYRTVTGIESRREVADLNALVHHVPPEWALEVLEPYGGFDKNAFGALAYRNGKLVSCAVTFVVYERLHVGWVATHPDHQKCGYGEAVMRQSMDAAAAASGFTRAALRSTAAGMPLYQRMGFRTVAHFRYSMMD